MERINRHEGPPAGHVVFVADGASAVDIARGKATVTAMFEAVDVHICAAALAAFRQEHYIPPVEGEFDIDALTDEERIKPLFINDLARLRSSRFARSRQLCHVGTFDCLQKTESGQSSVRNSIS